MSRYCIKLWLGAVLLAVGLQTHAASDPFMAMLPVTTAELSPGKVQTHALPKDVVLNQPLFIVGDDALSHRWLKAKSDYLRRINAKGIVVNSSKQGWLRLSRYSLPLYPVQGHDFAKAFGLTHYPVLIEHRTIKQ
ncbi:PFL_4695 family integrating conjugative element protein [Vibrio sp. TBV020]|uniref:PFL_4695 family integrating conjugative element protein n=1 Tax=Vibrio sp. TBV020 TaxID=3137398 RepID=UPI0038CD13D1